VTPAIELRGIAKHFGPIEVLRNIDLTLDPGRVHALAGENGAGKSTIVKMLGGIHQPDSGEILKGGQPVKLLGAAESQANGIAVVHQHPALFPDLSVAENIFINRQPRRHGRIDWAAMTRQARTLMERLRVDLDASLPVKALGVAERQAVEIARALSLDAQVLVLDEPTSALSGREVERLFEVVGHLKAQGVAILFITHFIDEILNFSDDVTVLRSGTRVMSAPAAELRPEDIVRAMIGTRLESFYPKQDAQIGAPVLSVEGLSGASLVQDVSFDLRSGEILGFFGLVGAGRSEVASMLFGIESATRGRILLDGRKVAPRSPREAIRLGISLVPEDRHAQGLVLPFPIRANETLPVLGALSGLFGLVRRSKENKIATEFSTRMRVKATGIEQATGALSGGNQQKVLLAKWLIPSPKVLILDEPTRGIDVGAKSEIHRTISGLAVAGMSIILISDDAEELIGMADRILVFRGGRISAQSERSAFSREALLLAAAHATQAMAGGMTRAVSVSLSEDRPRSSLTRLRQMRELGLVAALLLICAAITLREPRFLEGANLEQVLLSATLVCIVALGQGLIIIARQIDLSVGAMVATSAFVATDWLSGHPDASIATVALIGCTVGGVMGMGNAILVAGLRIPAIVATLGTLAIYRGGVIVYAGGRQISATVLPPSYGAIAQTHVFGLSPLVWIALALTVILGLAARYTHTGRNFYALGSNPDGAAFAGISPGRQIAILFVLSGLLCGLVGVLWGARFGTVDAVIAPDLQLQTISAAVIGGVSIFGGSGSVFGAAVGALIFAVLQNGVQLLGLSQFWIQAVVGAAILSTVVFYSRLTGRSETGGLKHKRGGTR